MIEKTADGSWIDSNDRVLFFSAKRFERDIWQEQGMSCFICGTRKDAASFSDEHVLPNWILRRHRLHDTSIDLPNGRTHQYGTYTIPCCSLCNDLLGRELETPISAVLKGGHAALAERISTDGGFLTSLFVWLTLIFIKIHLKDTTLRQHLDFKLGNSSIAEDNEYDAYLFHHLHCIARSPFTRASLNANAIGSIAIFAAKRAEPTFDLLDLTDASTIALRMDDLAIVAVLDDASAVNNGLNDLLSKIRGPLDPVQIREVAAHFACCNLHLENRPRFHTVVDPQEPHHVRIIGTHDEELRFLKLDKTILGRIMMRVVGRYVPSYAHDHCLNGNWTFLFDENGNFDR